MATLDEILTGLQIFQYYDGDDGLVAAGHDELFAGSVEPDDMREKHRNTLETMGWSWDEDFECWHHFT